MDEWMDGCMDTHTALGGPQQTMPTRLLLLYSMVRSQGTCCMNTVTCLALLA